MEIPIILSSATLAISIVWLVRKVLKKIRHSDCMVSTDNDVIAMKYDHKKKEEPKIEQKASSESDSSSESK
jgi:hypothetical protein